MAGKVRHPAAAVVLLGVKTVQAMIAAASSGLLEGEDDYGVGWVHALSTAAACRVVARAVRSSEPEAFNAGLLHDIGTVLLERVDPDGVERADHAEVGAAVLSAWRFPTALVRAVAGHHGGAERRTDTLSRVLAAGEAVAAAVEPAVGDFDGDASEALLSVGLRSDDMSKLTSEASKDLDRLLDSIAKGARR
jgi:putative nucleotidyltransferase with HDIG domain